MQKFEVTVKDNKYEAELEVGVRLVSSGYEDEYMLRRYRSDETSDTTYLARVASAVMSRFCARLFPRYSIRLELGKPHEVFYSYDKTFEYELRVIIRGHMGKAEQALMLEELNRIVAESQREALS